MTAVELYSLTLAQGILRNPVVLGLVMMMAIPVVFVCLYNLVRDLRKQEDKRVEDRLMGKSTRKSSQKSEEEIRKSLIKKTALASASAGGGLFKSFSSFQPIDNLQKACFQADLDWNAAKLVARLVLSSVGVTVVLILLGLSTLKGLFVGFAIFFSPIMYIHFLKKRRLYALVEQLPEVFDTMTSALRAGQSLAAAINVVSEQLPEPSRTEFGIVYHEQNFGVSMEEALGNMRSRLNQMDISFFVTAVQIQRKAGGDLAEVLEKIGSIIRARIKLFGQVKVLTAEGRMSGIVLLSLPPFMVVVMWFMNEEYASRLLFEAAGHKMMMVAGVMELLGWAMIKKIITIEV